jgi:DNA-binding transcriptional MerR regulator
MLKIGEFSRLSQVTVKALHHYDDLGLLQPATIDKFTGYRYYTVQQLPRIHRIIALKELGLSLEQIGLMLDEEVGVEEMRGMLRLKRAEIQQQVQEDQRCLAMVDFRLRMIEAEDKMPELDVVVKRLEPMRVLSLRRVFHNWAEVMAVGKEIERADTVQHVQHKGIFMNVFYGDEYRPDDFEIEFITPVRDEQTEDVQLESQGVLVLRDEPAIETAATLMLHGLTQR